jgi:rhamnulokinase
MIAGRLDRGWVRLEEVHRFNTNSLHLPDGLHWDLSGLYVQIMEGLRRVATSVDGPVSIGINAWGCDYGLIDDKGRLLGLPYHHRDQRTSRVIPEVHVRLSPESLYSRTGVQFLPFNTMYQLADDLAAGRLARPSSMLMLPDLLGFWLTGKIEGEVTIASTTGLLDLTKRDWSDDLVGELGIPRGLLPPLYEPGTTTGSLRSEVCNETGLHPDSIVVRVGSHDTASAVVAAPGHGDSWAYLVAGTWSLVGVELDEPIMTEESRRANFTNEAGVDEQVRFLRNVMGLWLLQESVRSWDLAGPSRPISVLLAAAADEPAGGPVIDPDDTRLLAPGDMPARIRQLCRETGQPEPSTTGAIVRCIHDSLATRYARTIEEIEELTDHSIETIHMIGAGSQNPLLCQLTANTAGRPVVAGPAEATALGNLLVQARAAGDLDADLDRMRSIIGRSQPMRRFEPGAAG